MNFKGKVVLVTGASSGIGEVTAIYLSSLGANVSLTGRNENNLKKAVEECKKSNKNGDHVYIVGDISKEADVRNILEKTVIKYGRLDVLINNAGFGIFQTLETIELKDYDAIQNTNIRGLLFLTKLAMPHLIKSQGNVVNVSSVVGIRAAVGSLGYSISKAAMDMFTKCVALEVAPKKVRVNSVNPGAVRTNFGERMGFIDNQFEDLCKLHPIGRVGTSQEVANTIAFLASDLASNITGILFSVDGGFVIANSLAHKE